MKENWSSRRNLVKKKFLDSSLNLMQRRFKFQGFNYFATELFSQDRKFFASTKWWPASSFLHNLKCFNEATFQQKISFVWIWREFKIYACTKLAISLGKLWNSNFTQLVWLLFWVVISDFNLNCWELLVELRWSQQTLKWKARIDVLLKIQISNAKEFTTSYKYIMFMLWIYPFISDEGWGEGGGVIHVQQRHQSKHEKAKQCTQISPR